MPLCTVVSGGVGLPTRSLDFPDMYPSGKLYMADADFGGFDHSKIAFSFHYIIDNPMTSMVFEKQGEFRLEQALSGNVLTMYYYVGGATNSFTITTNPSTSTWYHYYITCDPNNATSSERLKIYINGTLETAASSSLALSGDIDNTANGMYLGSGDGGFEIDGRIYQFTMFAGAFPPVSYVYSGGAKDVSNLVGIHSYLHTLSSGDLEDDMYLSTNWTNGGNVIKSASIP